MLWGTLRVALIGMEMDQYKVGPYYRYKWSDMGTL